MKNIILLLLFPFCSLAQTESKTGKFNEVDKFAKTIKYEGKLDKLAQDLTKPYSDNTLKARAIFIWITDNIKYDVRKFNKGKFIDDYPTCDNIVDCNEAIKQWERNFLDKVIRKKKAVCSGYSMLFKYLCNVAGITCEVVPGYTKTEEYQIGCGFSVEHAWNVVYLDSQYYHLDATWAAGGCTLKKDGEKLKKFHKDFKEYYWLTPFNKFVRNHYPENPQWVLQKNYTKEKFVNAPYYSNKIVRDFELLSPKSEFLNVKVGDTIHFKFLYNGSVNKIQLNTSLFRNMDVYVVEKGKEKIDKDALKEQKYIDYKRTDNIYEFDYVVTSTSLYYIDMLFDYRTVFRTKLKTTESKSL